jgi:hypothetical protein
MSGLEFTVYWFIVFCGLWQKRRRHRHEHQEQQKQQQQQQHSNNYNSASHNRSIIAVRSRPVAIECLRSSQSSALYEVGNVFVRLRVTEEKLVTVLL